VSATDFSVVMTQKPYTDTIEILKGIYWGWAENILEKEPYAYKNPMTNMNDMN